MIAIRCLLPLLVLAASWHGALAQGAGTPSLLGRWDIVQAVLAPWVGDAGAVRESDVRKLLKQRVVFSEKSVSSHVPTLNCSDASYAPTRLPPAGLFQGGLPEPNQAAFAKAIGFSDGNVPGVDLACSTGLFSFHFRNRDTALLALDNVIYTLQRR